MYTLALGRLEQKSCDCELIAVVRLLGSKINEGVERASSWAGPDTKTVTRGGSVVKVEGKAMKRMVEKSGVAARKGGLELMGDRVGGKS